jgi:hypothetical protein
VGRTVRYPEGQGQKRLEKRLQARRQMVWAAPSGDIPALVRAEVAQQRRVGKWTSRK